MAKMEILGGSVRPVLQILNLFQSIKCHFSHQPGPQGAFLRFHTRFQTWFLRNYVIITWIRTLTKYTLNSRISRIILIHMELKR